MVMQSSQISGMVGGQMAMFSNQQAYAQQISGLYGTGAQSGMGGMANPFPSDAGSSAVTGAMGMAGGAVGAASLAGGFMGGAAGMLDPFTGSMKAFGAGRAAMGGAGMLGMAGGMMAAAPAAAAYYAGGSAIMGAAQQVGAGAQNVADVGMLANAYMGPQFGQAGARPGGGAGRSQIRQMTSVMEELAGDDVGVTMESLKRLMDKAGQMGSLQGIGDAQQFKSKFGGMVKQLKSMADVMGTSLEEAAPLFGQMQQMGMWKTSDVMSTSLAMKAAGPAAAPALMGAMQQGSQMSYALGGSLSAGATQGRNMFMDVSAARSSGALSSEQLREFTGGVGGVRGQQMLAQSMQGVMGRFSKSPMGNLMMAGLGKFEDGKFTGGIDEGAMEQFMSGDLSVGELQSRGQKRSSSSREAATSFQVKKGGIGQDMMAQGGIGGLGAAITQVMKKAGYGDAGENIQNMFIQKMTGVDARTAEMIRKFGDDLPQIQEEKQRKLEAALDDSFQEVDRKLNHSWQGFKESYAQATEKSWEPFRELGANIATGIGRRMDRVSDAITGRTRSFGMSTRQVQNQMFSEGGLGGGEGGLSLSARGSSGMRGSTSVSERMRNMASRDQSYFGMGGLAGSALGLEAGTSGEALGRRGADTMQVGAGDPLQAGFTRVDEGGGFSSGIAQALGAAIGGGAGAMIGAGAVYAESVLGTGTAVNASQRAEVIAGAITRGEDRSWSGLGFSGDKDSVRNKGSLERAKSGMRRLLSSDSKLSREFAEFKKANPEAHKQTKWLMKKLRKKDPEAAEALDDLARSSGKTSAGGKTMDAVALVMEEAGMKGPWTPDYDKDAEWARGEQRLTSTEEYDTAIGESIQVAADMAENSATAGGIIGAAIGAGMGPVGMMLGGAIGTAIGGAFGGASEETRSLMEETMQADWGDTVAKALAGDPEAMDALNNLPPKAAEARDKIAALVGDDPARMKAIGAQLGDVQKKRFGEARLRQMQQTSKMAKGALSKGISIKGEQGATLNKLLETYAGGDFASGGGGAEGKAAGLLAQLMTGKEGDLKRLSREGGTIGRGIAAFGRARTSIGGFKTGEGVSMEDLDMEGGIPSGMKDELQKMLDSGGEFTESERDKFQQMFTDRASKAGVGGTLTGRKAASDVLNESLTKYTSANTKFVSEVGNAINLMNEGTIAAVARRGEEVVKLFTGKKPADGGAK